VRRVSALLPIITTILSSCAPNEVAFEGAPFPVRASLPAPASPQPSASVAPPEAAAGEPSGDCPAGMKLVDTTFCPEVRRTCLKDEYSKSNKITICHKFQKAPPRCAGGAQRRRFCIDEYEYPNKKGARSPVMVDWHDAAAICAGEKKRLCWEGEWTAACEGPESLPFPYGYDRSPEACNIENPWIMPRLSKLYDASSAVSGAELTRLDQGVASGAKPGCVSGFGVRDQTGNVDEWVMLEKKRGEGGWAGLKGGAWGHVRNACRPVTTSHAPEFTYYFVSFRCCADAAPAAAGGAPLWTPPPLPASKKSPSSASRGWTPAR